MNEGQQQEQALRNAGFGEEEVTQWKSQTADALYKGGFTDTDVKQYFGVPEPDTAGMKEYVKGNLAKNLTTEAGPKEASTFLEAVEAGWDMSVSGLMMGKPDVILPENAGRALQIASMVSTMAGDIPAMIAGGVAGQMGGAVAGGAAGSVVPVVGTLAGIGAGAVAGGAAGAFALPSGLRKVMMDHYEKGDITSSGDFLDRLSAATWETVKGGAIGVATMGAGRLAGPIATKSIGAAGGKVAEAAAEIGTMTTVGAALEGELPNANDFINAGIVLGGLHGSMKVAGKLRKVYAERGQQPTAVLENTKADIELKQQILAENPNMPIKDPRFEEIKVSQKSLVEDAVPSEKLVVPKEIEVKAESPTQWNEFYKGFVDDLDPVKRAVKQMAEGSELNPSSDAYQLMRTYKDYQGKVARAYEYNTIDFKTGAANGEALKAIIKDVPKKEGMGLTEFEAKIIERIDPEARAKRGDSWGKLTAYLTSKRAIELEGRGIKTGIDIEAAKTVVKSSAKEYEAVSQRLQDFQARVKKYVEDSGVLTPEASKAMDAANKAYIPFYRLMEEADFEAAGPKASAKLFKRIKGSEKQILDPIESVYKNTAAAFRIAEKNRSLNALVDLAEKSPAGETLFKKKPTAVKPIEVKPEEIGKFLEGQGFDTAEIPPEGFTIWRGFNQNLKSNEFEVVRNGKREVYQTTPEIAEAVKAMDYHPGMTSMWYNMFVKLPATALRVGVTSAPDFIFRNYFRDQLTSAVQSKYRGVPFTETLSALGSVFKKDAAWQEFLSSGGASAGFGEVKRFLETDVLSLNKEVGFMGKSWNVIKSPFDALAMISELVENVPRLTQFKRGGGVEGNLDVKISAAMAARESTIDFARSGAKIRAANAIIPFLNAGIQGNDRMIRAFKEAPAETLTRASAMLTLPTAMLWWANKDDSRYKDAPNWEKDLYWLIPMDKWEKASGYADAMSRPEDLRHQNPDGSWEVNNGPVFRLPKPFGFGTLFGSLPERALNAFYQQDPKAFTGFSETIMGGLVPNILPAAFTPIGEQAVNKSFFTGNKIVGSHMEKFLPEYQYNEYTSETAKQIGKIVSYVPGLRDFGPKDAKLSSPVVIENYIRQWSGTMGSYVVKLADQGLKAAGVGGNVEFPTKKLADYPIIKAFVMRYPHAKLQPIEDFQANFESTSKVVETVNALAKSGNIEAAQKLMEAQPDMYINLGGIARALQEQNRSIHKIVANPSMSKDDKRQLVDSIYYQMTELARSGNKMLGDYQNSLGIANKKKQGEN